MYVCAYTTIYWHELRLLIHVNDAPSAAQVDVIFTDLSSFEGIKGQHVDVSSLVDTCYICRCILTSDFRSRRL